MSNNFIIIYHRNSIFIMLFSSVVHEYLLPRTGSKLCLYAWNPRMYEFKEKKPLQLEIGVASEIFDKSNSKTSMLANLVTVLCEWKWSFLRCNKFLKVTNLKFRMFICASCKFLKFRMLINSNAKFNVKCCFPTILAVFSTWSCRSTSLPFLLVKKKCLPLKKKSNFLMLTKRQDKVADS